MAVDTLNTRTEEPKDDASRLDMFKLDITRDADAMFDQTDAANMDMRFINVPGGMWEGFDVQFDNRTKLELDLVSSYIQRFIGNWNQRRVGVEYESDDSATSDDDAELLNGIYRADHRQNSGKMSQDNAVDEVATCGYGAYKLATKFEDEGDPENEDQTIEWRPIHNAYNTVYWESSANRIDKRDATRVTQLIPFTREGFEKKYPDFDAVSAYTPRMYFTTTTSQRRANLIYVAVRYEIIKEETEVWVYNNLQTGRVETYTEEDRELIADEIKSNEFLVFVRKRKITKQIVEKTIFSGVDILHAAQRIAGEWLPIIPIYAYHSYVDGVEWYRGLVRKLIDAARLFNMQMSQLAENAASAGQEVPIFAPQQMVNTTIKAMWADKNNKPYLLADPLKDKDGNIVSQGPIGYSKPAMLDQSTSVLLDKVPAFIESITGGNPQDILDPNMSGKLFKAIERRLDMNTQTVTDNVHNAIEWEGVVYQSMASDGIYNRARMVSTLGRDGTKGRKQLRQIVQDSDTGGLTEVNNLTGKKFRVFADVGQPYDTLKEQTVEDLKGMMDALGDRPAGQQYMDAIVSTLLDNVTGVGLGPLKDLNRRLMIQSGLVKPETDEEKKQLAEFQQQQQQSQASDPQQQLLQAAAKQQESEARNLDSKSLANAADASKKVAETEQIFSNIEIAEAEAGAKIQQGAAKSRNDELNTLLEARRFAFEGVQGLPFQ